MSNKVDYFVIGAGKAGSTTLYDIINSFEEFEGSVPKEVRYFSNFYSEQDVTWYESHFKNIDCKKSFEASPQYTFRDEFPNVVSRIKNYNPHAKFIYILREPLSRIVSHFNHWHRSDPQTYSNINSVIWGGGNYRQFIKRTMYFYQLKKYIDEFGESNLKVLFLEDYQNDLSFFSNELTSFLDIEAREAPVIHSNNVKNSTSKSFSINDMRDETVEFIINSLKDDVRHLHNYVGRLPAQWQNYW